MPEENPGNFRIFPGALASAALERWAVRTLLLEEAARMYPEMRADLLRISEEYSRISQEQTIEVRRRRIKELRWRKQSPGARAGCA